MNRRSMGGPTRPEMKEDKKPVKYKDSLLHLPILTTC